MGRELTNTTDLVAVLSALGIPASRRVAVLGDSGVSRNHNTPLTGNQSYGRGAVAQACAMGMGAWYFGPELNFGVSGDTSAGVLARVGAASIDALISAAPARCIVLVGSNDLTGGVTKEALWANLQAIYNRLNVAGIAVDAIPILPRGDGQSASFRAKMHWINRRIIAERLVRPQSMYGVIPAHDIITLKSSSVGDPVSAAMDTDHIHVIEYGAMLMGQGIADYYSKIWPHQAPYAAYSRAMAYDATDNPLGCLNAYPLLAGNTGTLGAGASGVAAAGWTILRSSGSTLSLTCAVTTLPDADGRQVQDIALGSSGTGASAEIAYMASGNITLPAGISVGTKLRAVADVECINVANVANIYLASASGTTGQTAKSLAGTGVTGDRTLANSRRRLETPIIVSAAVGEIMNVAIYITADCSGAAPSGTIRVRYAALIPEA